MTPNSIITTARYLVQDLGTQSGIFRQSAAELLGYVNEALKEAAVLRPDLFTSVKAFPCVVGQCEQTLDYADTARLLDVLCITGGAALTPMDRMSMDQFRPAWRTDPAGPAVQWSPLEGDPLRFFIYPKAPAAQTLDVKYVRIPATYELADVITDLADTFEPALADYVIYRTEMKDDEHALSQRAGAHYTAFKAKLGAN